MSAKRRQETLETFCVPIEHDMRETSNVHPIPDLPPSEVQQTRRSTRLSRREATGGEYQQANAMPTNSDDDDDFVLQIDVDSDDDVSGVRPRGKKGKAKAKGKSKAPIQSRATSSSISNGVNPKVMLISLKAGALGLNLTVANNIYL